MNKKIVVVFGLIFALIPTAIGSTYKIKNGTVINPNGQVINRENVNTNSNKEEIIYSQEQNIQNTDNKSDITIEHPIEHLVRKSYLTKNEAILRSPKPTVDIASIISKYGRDPNAAANKIAIQQNKEPFGCTITTFSNSSEYAVNCGLSKYTYYYKSVDDPQLIRFDYNTKIKSNEVALCYFKTGTSNDIKSWVFKQIVIFYFLSDFIYEKTDNKYKLTVYYTGNTAYTPDGKYNHTRYIKDLN